MNLKDCLMQYCDVREEIKELEKRIDNLEKENSEFSVVQASSLTSPFLLGEERIYHTDFRKSRKIQELKGILKYRYDRLLEQQIKVEEFINELPTSRLRRIFEYRYICQFSWARVAIEINKNKKGNYVTDESVKKEHYRYLETLS